MRLVTGTLRLGIGTPTILDALAQVYAGGRAAGLVLERAYSICCDLGLVAGSLAAGGLAAVERLRVRPGHPIRAMLAQRLSSAAEILARLGGSCAAEYKYDGMRVQAHRTADGQLELFTRRLERVSDQFPDIVAMLDRGLRPATAIVEGEVVAADPVYGQLRPFQQVMYRRRKHGMTDAVRDVPVSLLCFDLLYADGRDLTRLPYPQRRARLAAAIKTSAQLQLAIATRVADVAALEAAFDQAVTDGCEGLVCKALAPSAGYQAGARDWLWIKLKRDYRTELADTLDLVVVGGLWGRGRRRGRYGAVLLAGYDPDTDTFPTVCKCGTGFSDADLATLPTRLAALARSTRPARVDARQTADVWFEPGLVIEVRGAELTHSPTHAAAWGRVKDNAGLALRFPRFTGRYRDDKAPEDATTVEEILDLYRTARPEHAGLPRAAASPEQTAVRCWPMAGLPLAGLVWNSSSRGSSLAHAGLADTVGGRTTAVGGYPQPVDAHSTNCGQHDTGSLLAERTLAPSTARRPGHSVAADPARSGLDVDRLDEVRTA